MHRLVVIVALVMSTPVNPRTQKAPAFVTAELASLDQQWQEAVVSGDAEFIEQRTASSFSFTHGGGTTRDTKADWVRNAKQVPRRYLERKTSNQSVEVHGDVALVFERLDVRVPGRAESGPSCYAVQYVHLYSRQNEPRRWLTTQWSRRA